MSEAVTLERDPSAVVAEIEARARRVETPCGDGTMTWRIWGEGAPLVVGHGAQGAWSHWMRNIDALAKDRMVIAVDLPGQGNSAEPATSDHAGISAALASGLREILEPGQQADFAGFSFSGIAFAWFAHYHPEFVRRLILIGCGGLGTPHGHTDIQPAKGLVGEERKARLKGNLLGLMLHHPESVDELALHLLVENARNTRWVQVDMVIPDRLVAVLPKVKARVDAIWGEFDRPHPNPPVQEAVIRRSHPDCDFRVIEGAGHWVMYERAEAFNAALRDMLKT
ncbi:MAG TPA: alpha/beta fold hydrolase [Novosphingobium sp.]